MNPYAPPRDHSQRSRRRPTFRLDAWYSFVLMVLFMITPGVVLAVAASL